MPKKQQPHRPRRRSKQLNPTTRGEDVRRREFLQAARFEQETKGTGRSGQATEARERAHKALLRQQRVTAARRRRAQPLRPPLQPRR